MTITSNTPSQINAALMDLQRRNASKQIFDKNALKEVEKTLSGDNEIRFYLETFSAYRPATYAANLNGLTAHSYILLGDVIILYGQQAIDSGYSWKLINPNALSGDYCDQPYRTIELPIPYNIATGLCIWGSSLTGGPQYPGQEWRYRYGGISYNNPVGRTGTWSVNKPVVFAGNKSVTFSYECYWYRTRPSGASDVLIKPANCWWINNYFIIGRVSV